MHALSQTNERLNRIEKDIREINKSVGSVKRVIWIAAGVVATIGLLGSFLFDLGDVITKFPFEITIRNPPVP